MKNLIVNIFKTLFFFDLSLIVISLLPDLKTENPALALLWKEGMGLAVVFAFTLFFLLVVEKRKLKLYSKKGKFKSIMGGIALGIMFPVAIGGVMWLLKLIKISGVNKTEQIYFYIAAVLLNAIAGELLIRGYLFRLYNKHYGLIIATIISTALFICMNSQILKYCKMYIAGIILMNIFLCLITDKAKGPINIAARFIYTLLSGFGLGGKLFTEEYPLFLKASFQGKKLLSGGEYGIEGSIITVIIFAVINIYILNKKYNLAQYLKKENLKRWALDIKYFLLRLKSFFKFRRIR